MWSCIHSLQVNGRRPCMQQLVCCEIPPICILNVLQTVMLVHCSLCLCKAAGHTCDEHAEVC